MKLTTGKYNNMYKLQMQDTRNKKPDLKDKILGMTLHTENAKKKEKRKRKKEKKPYQKLLELITKFNKATRYKNQQKIISFIYFYMNHLKSNFILIL